MAEPSPDMSRIHAEADAEMEGKPIGFDSATPAETRRSAELAMQMTQDQAQSEREAAELSAGLKKEAPLMHAEEQKKESVWSAGAKLTAGSVGPVSTGLLGWIGKKFSGILTELERSGHADMKKWGKYVKWVPFIGPWLMKEPKKSWEEVEAEEKKKKEQEEKQKKKEGEKVEKLKAKGISEDLAKALIEGTVIDEKEEEKKEEKEEKAEEKKAA